MSMEKFIIQFVSPEGKVGFAKYPGGIVPDYNKADAVSYYTAVRLRRALMKGKSIIAKGIDVSICFVTSEGVFPCDEDQVLIDLEVETEVVQ